VHGVGIRRGVDRDGLNAHLAASAYNPERNLAPVGDQDLIEHRVTR
jgi:hypothetical protein